MCEEELEGILTFVKKAENLKNTLRYAFTSNGRQESAAEHSWRLCLLVMLCAYRFPHLRLEKLLKLAVIHDLAEAVCGDIPAPEQGTRESKAALERASLADMVRPLPDSLKQEISALWEEYEAVATEEAQCVKAFDKLETLLQHNQGINPQCFDYAFNLVYGIEATNMHATTALLRMMIDRETNSRIKQ
jgi:putative hydrolase of HD superfamily